jgi:transcriptional regulator GlxA family with amidase domain
MMPRATRVAVLVFDGAPIFETAVPLSVFGIDRTSTGAPPFEVLPVAASGRSARSTAGTRVHAPYRLADLAGADVVVVPTWSDPHTPPPAAVLRALRQAHCEGALVVGLCLGAFVLAAAGLLDDRRATTHWMYADLLAERFPEVTVDAPALYVDEGSVVTSAGTAAGLDACLHVVRRLHGADAASTIARRMVVAPQRAGGQAQFIEPVPVAPEADELGDVVARVLAQLDEPVDVDRLAAMARMSRRTFDRRFREKFGSSPLQWVLHQRILRAQRLLETTDLPIDEVARRSGFATGVTLRPHFRSVVGVSPQAYRRTFLAPA